MPSQKRQIRDEEEYEQERGWPVDLQPNMSCSVHKVQVLATTPPAPQHPHGRSKSGSGGKLTFSRVVRTNCSGDECGAVCVTVPSTPFKAQLAT